MLYLLLRLLLSSSSSSSCRTHLRPAIALQTQQKLKKLEKKKKERRNGEKEWARAIHLGGKSWMSQLLVPGPQPGWIISLCNLTGQQATEQRFSEAWRTAALRSRYKARSIIALHSCHNKDEHLTTYYRRVSDSNKIQRLFTPALRKAIEITASRN